VADLVIGNCNDDLETGVLFLESPPVVIPAIADDQIVLGFDHWIATEQNFDGGNLKIDVNGDGFGLVPSSAFIFNPYNTSLNPMPDNDNPMAGEEAFTGSNPGSVTGSWGQSQVNLTGLVLPGDTLRIRFEMGLDGCNGVQGWYIDTIALQYCAPCEDSDGDGYGVPGNAVCPAGAAEDCDDGDPDNHPGNAEVCDGLDNNCDTLADNAAECCPGGALTECSDVNDDGIRDDNCVWWSCELGGCSGIDVVFSDIGGQFGACPPDGAADGNDRFHALNCFSDINTLGAAPYLCEENPPVAFNVDAGGQFGQCCPDGVCDGNDAFHALNAFAGVSPCECPRNFVCPCPVPTDPPQNPVLCPDGPSPGLPPDSAGTRVVGTAEIRLSAGRRAVRPGGLIEVVALVENSLADLRGYQLHVAAVGGKRGHLELVDVAVEQRGDHVFAGHGDWRAFNVHTAQMVAGLDSAGLATRPGAYLATFTFRASADASGTFVVDLLHDASDSGQRTFLFPTPVGAKIAVGATTPARVTVQP
jgi:hypothetical protein